MRIFLLKSGRSKKNFKKGFTLIELLVSIMLFTIFLGIVSQSYLSIVRAQRQANEVRKMYSEVRVFMDTLAEDIRLSSVDYGCYEQGMMYLFVSGKAVCDAESIGTIVSGKTNVLSLLKKGGDEKVTYKIEEDLEGRRRLMVKRWYFDYDTANWLSVPGYEDFRSVFSDRLEINYASFAIYPGTNPYSSLNYMDNAVQFQPKVTTFLGIGNAEGTNVDFDYQFQTTISSRVYSRES